MTHLDLLDPTGPQRSHQRPSTVYRAATDAQPRNVTRDPDGSLWGEVPVVPDQKAGEETPRDYRSRRDAIRLAPVEAREDPPERVQHRPVVPDLDGYDLRPNPLDAETPQEFVQAMSRYRRWAGNPSYRALAEGCRHMYSAAAFHAVLKGAELPKFTLLNAFIIACGGDGNEFQRWATAWRTIDQKGLGTPSPLVLLPPPPEGAHD